jgi:hypothetical protein
MSPGLKYTLGRAGLFLVCAAATLPLPVPLLVKLLIALLVSAPLSYFLLKRWRLEFAGQLDSRARRRREQKERLRAALRGDEPADSGDTAGDAAAHQP